MSIIVTSILSVLTVFRQKLDLSSLLIMEINHGDSFVEVTIHICMVFGYDLLCDSLEMSNFNNYRSAVATRRNLVDPIQSRNTEEYP
jgi:hypothetical protein